MLKVRKETVKCLIAPSFNNSGISLYCEIIKLGPINYPVNIDQLERTCYGSHVMR